MSKNLAMRIVLILLSLCLAFPALSQSLTEKEIKVVGYGEKKFKKAPKKVFIVGFDLYFQMTASAEAQAKSNANFKKGSASSSMTIAIKGVDVPELTQITNNVYADFVSKLEGQGYEVMAAEDAAQTKFYEDHDLLKGNMNSAQLPGFIKATPEGYGYFVKKITKKGKEKTGLLPINAKLSKQLEDAVLMYVSFNFRAFKVKASQSSVLSIASVKGGIDFKMEGGTMHIGYGNPAGLAFNASMSSLLKKPIPIEGIFLNEDEKFKQVAMGSYSPAYAGYVLQHSQSKQITHQAECDTEKYMATTTNLMKQYSGVVLDQFFTYTN